MSSYNPSTLRYSPVTPLSRAPQVPEGRGVYRILRQGNLIYVGQANNLRRRLMQHLWCLTHMQVATAPYTFRYALMPGSTALSRLGIERRIIDFHQRRGRLLQQREMEDEHRLTALEAEQEMEERYAGKRFAVYRVAAL